MNLDTATISVIVSGCVAIVGIVIAPVAPLIADWVKWRRERKEARTEAIRQSTVELLEILARFQSGRREVAAQGSEPTLGNLLSKYYAWEMTVWPNCRKADRERLKQLRAKFENESNKNATAIAEAYEKIRMAFYTEGPRLAKEILALANTANERV